MSPEQGIEGTIQGLAVGDRFMFAQPEGMITAVSFMAGPRRVELDGTWVISPQVAAVYKVSGIRRAFFGGKIGAWVTTSNMEDIGFADPELLGEYLRKRLHFATYLGVPVINV